MDNINLAKAFGFESVGAAVVFAILYIPLLGWYIRQSFARPTYVHFVLVVFCAIRIAAFILRAILISMDSVGKKLSNLITDEILFGVGFFGLLYSSYTLVLDLELMQDRPESSNPLIRLTKNRRLFRLVLLIAVILGIVASTEISSSGTISHTGKLERIVSTVIFLVLTILQAFQTFLLAQMELATRGAKRDNESFGSRHSMAILSLGALLLLVREVFYTATITNTAKQNQEHFWYPLVAVPEILVVILSAIPGLVPRREEIQQRLPKLQSAPFYNV
ncbi:hypothetical protein BJ912DRAFT_1021525 [Pholiota molesta]|nr:hypothetical protein BJ912DRAFT_1021525 [Pholiota molesta]